MKHVILLPVLAASLFITGCIYDAPLTAEHKIPVNPAVLGLWEEIDDEDEDSGLAERMMVLKYSDTEYLVHYPTGDDGIYFRCYPIKIGGIPCIQLQIIGASDGPVEKDEKNLFYVVSYQLKEGELEIKLLNTDLVGDEKLKTTAELTKAFLKHKDNKDLFSDPGKFKKVEE